jgi:type II secretory pathway pseudopilin PulG
MVVIAVLCGLMTMIMGVQRYAQNKSRRSRAEVQIAAFSAAAESYKADNATYPRTTETDANLSIGSIGGNTTLAPFVKANLMFYAMLSGDWDFNGKPDAAEAGAGSQNAPTAYMAFTSTQLSITDGKVKYLQDPWSKAFGYSTKRASVIENGADDAAAGHNVTFDIWSTAGSDENEKAWVGNW